MDWKTSLKRGPLSENQADQLNEVLPSLDSRQFQWLNGYLTGIEAFMHEDTMVAPQQKEVLQSTKSVKSTPIWILYGTHTGNCENLAKEAAKRFEKTGREAKVSDMESFKTKNLKKIQELLIIVSTDGEGDPPPQAEEFLEFLQGKRAPKLDHISYSVLALGDSSYAEFCQTGKDFDAALAKKGAHRIKDRVDCDVDFEDNFEEWISEVTSKSGMSVGNNGELVGARVPQAAATATSTVYNKKNPFPATILKKVNLNGRGSTKETIHLELDLAESELKYEPGDALGIYALNNSKLVHTILEKLKFSGKEEVETHQGVKSLEEALLSDYELTTITNLSLKKYIELTNSSKLIKISEDKKARSEYLYGRDILDLISEEEYEFTPQSFISILRKNMPRMYSIASSQEEVEDEVHILVSSVRYNAHGRDKEGLCSSFLADQIQEDDQVKVFIDPNSRFKLPKEAEKPIIMVGPGTGVAPFRSFIQQRDAQENPGKSWLFFGDRNFLSDFLYQTEWLQYREEGLLTQADIAFSRDQEEKVYVQHKMIEKGEELFQWLEEGAHFYVCGDKDHMAKDVDLALNTIIQNHGKKTEEEAKDYVKQLRKTGRYQTDVY